MILEFDRDFSPHDPDRIASIDGQHDPDGHTNGYRAQCAADKLRDPDSLREEGDYSDLITNLLHLANREGFDVADILTAAVRDIEQEAGQLF